MALLSVFLFCKTAPSVSSASGADPDHFLRRCAAGLEMKKERVV
jgi:hypothetical protein